jgi:hypothetical protein
VYQPVSIDRGLRETFTWALHVRCELQLVYLIYHLVVGTSVLCVQCKTQGRGSSSAMVPFDYEMKAFCLDKYLMSSKIFDNSHHNSDLQRIV